MVEILTGVDTHAHVMNMQSTLISGRHSAPRSDFTVDQYIGLLDRHALSHGLLTQPSFYGTDNSVLLAALRRYPDRLRGAAIVDPSISAAELSALHAAGIRGLRLNWFRRGTLPDIASPAYRHLLSTARDTALHIEIYVEGEKLADLLPTLRASGANLVVDHFGAPDPRGGVAGDAFRALLAAVEAGNTWVKLSAPYRLGGAPIQPYVDALMAAGGSERMLWGSDCPWVGHEDSQTYTRCVEQLREWVPDPVRRNAIMTTTPGRLLGL